MVPSESARERVAKAVVRVSLVSLFLWGSACRSDAVPHEPAPARDAPATRGASFLSSPPAPQAEADLKSSAAPKDAVGAGALAGSGAVGHAARVQWANAPSPSGASLGAFAARQNMVAGAAPKAGEAPTVADPASDGAPRATPLEHLDPNARYSTTYRPGGAALAAFDAASQRGQIPVVYRDLVGAFGERYALDAPAPTDGALAVTVRTDRAAAAPEGGPMNLAVTLAASAETPARAPLSVHLVLDTSGSMSGRAIDDARRAAAAVVAKLEDGDRFSMVTFSNEASVLVPDGAIGPRRGAVVARIGGVHADGGTNISAGLDLAYAQAKGDVAPDDAVRIVMLLSDGYANAGDTEPQHLGDRASSAFQSGIQTSAFGLGGDYDAALMSRIADRGAGGYYYLADSSQIAPALATEIDARMRPVATAVELRVRLRPGVVATHVFGSRELGGAEAIAVRTQEVAIDAHERRGGIASDRQTDAAGGMRFFIPSFARADRHTTMITLALPPGGGPESVASVELRYKDRLRHRNVSSEVAVHVGHAASDAASAATADRSIEPLAQAFAAGETILDAADRVDAADRTGARRLLDERAEVLRRAAEALGDARLGEDADRVARLASAVGGDGSVRDPLPLVVMLRGSGYGYL
jgi:Ca-activated chloride channel family protein